MELYEATSRASWSIWAGFVSTLIECEGAEDGAPMLTTSMFRADSLRCPVAVAVELNRKVRVMLYPPRLVISKHSSFRPQERGDPPLGPVELLPKKVPVWFAVAGLNTLVLIFEGSEFVAEVEFDTR